MTFRTAVLAAAAVAAVAAFVLLRWPGISVAASVTGSLLAFASTHLPRHGRERQ